MTVDEQSYTTVFSEQDSETKTTMYNTKFNSSITPRLAISTKKIGSTSYLELSKTLQTLKEEN